MLLELHLAILNRLRPLQDAAPGLQLSLMPESPNAFLRAVQGSRAVLLNHESRFEPEDVHRSQPWQVGFTLELRLPSNWNESGMIAVLEAALRLLVGYRPPQAHQRLVLERASLSGEYEQFWVQQITFWVPCRLRPDEPEVAALEIATLIRRIQGLSPAGATTLDVQIPGPEVNPPTAISAVREAGAVSFTWDPPEPSEGHSQVGYVAQAWVGHQWTHSAVLPATATQHFFADPSSHISQVRVLAMWPLENSAFSTVEVD
ncbi:MAG: Gp37 family protein [Spirulina sp.]